MHRNIIIRYCGVGALLVMLSANILVWHSTWIGVIFGSCWILGLAWRAGLYERGQTFEERFSYGLLAVVCTIMLAGTLWFYSAHFTDTAVVIITLLVSAVLYGIPVLPYERFSSCDNASEKRTVTSHLKLLSTRLSLSLRSQWPVWVLTLCYVTWYWLILSTILEYATDRAIRTPWEVLPHHLIMMYGLLTLLLVGIILFNKNIRDDSPSAHTPILGSLLMPMHFFLACSVALLVYRIGYGFDPFVHHAAETLLANTGTITPTPFLYIGQYTLVIFLSKLLALPLATTDLWLLPVFASIILPPLFYASIIAVMPECSRAARLGVLSFLIIPVFFIATIPQQFANLLYLIIVMLSLPLLMRRAPPSALMGGVGLAACTVHILAGIPALLYVSLMWLFSCIAGWQRWLAACAVIAGTTLMIPFLISLGNARNSTYTIASVSDIAFPDLIPRYLPFLSLAHTAELWHCALPLLLVCMSIAGSILLARRGMRAHAAVPWAVAGALGASYLLVHRAPLTAIIIYERAEFAERLLALAGITLVPFAVVTAAVVWQRACAARMRCVVITAIAAWCITVGWYYSYPRVDAFTKHRGFSVSQSDIDTVRWVHNDAAGEPYIALANQSVSAASLREFGFRKYYDTRTGKLFYYPIPTSSPLYGYYLDMVYHEPSRATVMEAMELMGVGRAYFILNDYWRDAEKISTRAAPDADAVHRLDALTVFIYYRSEK